jgi:hypothetical protein
MDTLPQELLDEILRYLVEDGFPATARYAVLTSSSKESILNGRLVQKRWFTSEILINVFVRMLEEKLCIWRDYKLPHVEVVAQSAYAERIRCLTICSLNEDLFFWHEHGWVDGATMREKQTLIDDYLVPLLRQIPEVKSIRYHTGQPEILEISRFNNKALRRTRNATRRLRHLRPWENDARSRRTANMAAWSLRCIGKVIQKAGLPIESIEMPLNGNRASIWAVQPEDLWYPKTLTRLAVNVVFGILTPTVQEWLCGLVNLRYLDLAFSYDLPRNVGPQPVWLTKSWKKLDSSIHPDVSQQLPRLKDFRLMGDLQHWFCVQDIFNLLDYFPGLERLGLAHVAVLADVTWPDLLVGLGPIKLKELWVLNPRHFVPGPIPIDIRQNLDWRMYRYLGCPALDSAAQEVCLFDTECPWPQGNYPPCKINFPFHGFALFEQSRKMADGKKKLAHDTQLGTHSPVPFEEDISE